MAYDLVLSDRLSEPSGQTKDIGENVLFDNLPSDCKVYLFSYPAAMPDEALEARLRTLGRMTGKNLFVNIGRLDDPQHDRIAKQFGVKRYPVLIMTALPALASPPDEYLTAYVRLDSSHLLNSSERTLECVQKLFTLFVRGEVAAAITQVKWRQRAELLASLKDFFAGALGALSGFLADRDLCISIALVKLELKKRGG